MTSTAICRDETKSFPNGAPPSYPVTLQCLKQEDFSDMLLDTSSSPFKGHDPKKETHREVAAVNVA